MWRGLRSLRGRAQLVRDRRIEDTAAGSPQSNFTPLMKNVGVARIPSCLPSATSLFTLVSVAAYFSSQSVTPPMSRAACLTEAGVIAG